MALAETEGKTMDAAPGSLQVPPEQLQHVRVTRVSPGPGLWAEQGFWLTWVLFRAGSLGRAEQRGHLALMGVLAM